MTARTAKQSVTSEDLLHVMGTRDKLLLAQLVHEFGCKDWTAIANLFNKHPLINLPSGVATKKSCRDVYIALMKEEGNDWEDAIPPEYEKAKFKGNEKLAQKWHAARILQLKEELQQQEEQYKIFLEEVRSIQEGRLPSAEADAIAPVEDKKRKGKGPPPTASLRRSTRSGARPSEPPQPETSPSRSRHSQTPSITRKPSEPVVEDEEMVDMGSSNVQQVEAPPATSKIPEDEMDVDKPSDADEPAAPPAEEEQDVPDAKEAEEQKSPTPEPTLSRRMTRRQTVTRNTAHAKPEIPSGAPPTTNTRKRARGASDATVENDAVAKKPVVRGIIPQTTQTTSSTGSKGFKTAIMGVYQRIYELKNGVLFESPIKDIEAPGYSRSIKRPMDLKTIKQKVKDGSIKDSLEFQRDIYLMYANSVMYNRPTTDVFTMVQQMYRETEDHIRGFIQTEGWIAP